MQFSFIIERFNFIFNRALINVTRVNRRIQIFENIFFNDSLHDSNFFTFSAFKRFVKRFLNNITADANNKSEKTVKKNKEKSSKAKNIFHVFEKSRVDFHATSYAFFFSLFSQVARSFRNKRRSRL